MNEAPQKFRARTAIEIVEEAVRLLRRAPASVLVCHFIGSAPCLLYALYFFADLSRSAFAEDKVLGGSLTFAVLYLWMKCWQVVAAAQLRATLLGEGAPAWDRQRITRLIASQAILHPVGLILRLWASVLFLPYIWVAIFFQNVTVLGDGTAPGVRALCSNAWTEAKRWPGQAIGLTSLLGIFGLFLFINFCVLMGALPGLLKSLLGIETVFSQHTGGLFNLTFLLAALALTYLCLDPIRKAAIVLRCFYGAARRSGDDLAVELRSLTRPRAHAAALILAFSCLTAAPARAEVAAKKVEAAELDRSIGDVLERREFAWRGAREKRPERTREELSMAERWRKDFEDWRKEVLRKTAVGLRDLWKKIFGRKQGENAGNSGFSEWAGGVETMLWALLAMTGLVLAILMVQRWRRPPLAVAVAEPEVARPDLREEHVTADQLPEDGWLQLARELIQSGELRLALRASYLAGLAHLGHRQLIQLARHKSDRDYDRELARRARAQAELLAAFQTNLGVFERGWYGAHPVTRELLGEFSQNLDRIRTC